uniref:Galectin n=1 Tax=Glossina austeni TaxID=7395 RepID=A0A1A9USI8_GLOAU
MHIRDSQLAYKSYLNLLEILSRGEGTKREESELNKTNFFFAKGTTTVPTLEVWDIHWVIEQSRETERKYASMDTESFSAAPIALRGLQQLIPGTSIKVFGYTKSYCEKFSIDLIIENESRDIALHVRPQLPQYYITRNSKIRGVWGEPEISSALPFNLKRSNDVCIQILVTERRFLIGVNGSHFCKFYHRSVYRDIETIEVKGDLEGISVERAKLAYYPPRLPQTRPINIGVGGSLRSDNTLAPTDSEMDETINVPKEWLKVSLPTRTPCPTITEFKLPFLGTIPRGSFSNGRMLKVDGRMKLLPQSFLINIQKGCNVWPHAKIALHLKADFSLQNAGVIGRATLLRNAYVNGQWGEGKRSYINCELHPGKAFSICILSAQKSYQIYINHNLVTEFLFPCDPRIIDTIYIEGDVKLWNVSLFEEILFQTINMKALSEMTWMSFLISKRKILFVGIVILLWLRLSCKNTVAIHKD